MLEGLAGGLLGGLGALGAQGVSRDMAREQMQFQEQMSNTAYQRATTDMQKAGINPMLAYMKGGADSAPGAMGTAENVGSAFMAGRQAQAQAKQAEAAADSATAQAEKTEAEKEGQEIDNNLKPFYAHIALKNAGSSALTAEKAGTNTWYNSGKQLLKDIKTYLGLDHSAKKAIMEAPEGSMYMRQK